MVAGLASTAAVATAALAYNPTATLDADLLTAEDYKFMEFVSTQGKSYGTMSEFKFRSQIFKQRLAEIEAFNAVEGQTSTVGINMFSDRTESEMKKMNGYKAEMKTSASYVSLDASNLEDTVDWRTKGAVTPVKNQGQCGSCWAFGATATVEAAHFVKTGTLLSLSEQEVVDCDTTSYGCQGGW